MTTNNDLSPITDFDDVTVINGFTARAWETLARDYEDDSRRNHQASSDSFDRCDTDGFLSQWAHDCTGRLNSSRAAWARDHGYCGVNVLTDASGAIVSTLEKTGQYGDYWVLNDAAAEAYGKRFFSESRASSWARKAVNNAAKGFRVARAMMPADKPQLRGSNMVSVHPASQPDWDRRSEIVIVDPCLFTTLSALHDHDNEVAAAMRAGKAILSATEPATEREARKGSHANCDHDNTKAARAKCRRTR